MTLSLPLIIHEIRQLPCWPKGWAGPGFCFSVSEDMVHMYYRSRWFVHGLFHMIYTWLGLAWISITGNWIEWMYETNPTGSSHVFVGWVFHESSLGGPWPWLLLGDHEVSKGIQESLCRISQVLKVSDDYAIFRSINRWFSWGENLILDATIEEIPDRERRSIVYLAWERKRPEEWHWTSMPKQ